MLTNWRVQHGKLKGYFSQNFSVEEDEITGMLLSTYKCMQHFTLQGGENIINYRVNRKHA